MAVEGESADALGAGFRIDGDEQLHHVRHARDGCPADVGVFVIDGYVAPAEDRDALVGGERAHPVDGLPSQLRVHRQKAGTRGIGVGAIRGRFGKVEVDGRAQQFVGQLDQDACAVAAVGLGSGGPRGARDSRVPGARRRRSNANDGHGCR